MIQETVWLNDIPVATLRPNGSGIDIYYVHTDHLNTPRRITRPSDNAIVWRWDSDPFGTIAADEDPDGDETELAYSLRFPGQYLDEETGLHYNYFRDYDPATGRYLQSDPIGLGGGLNTYGYAGANPLLYSDPTGLFFDEAGQFLKVCAQKAPVMATSAVAAAASGLALFLTPNSTAQCDVVVPEPDSTCDVEDDCARLYAQIDHAVQVAKRRYYELIQDKLNLPQSGRFSIEGHQKAFREWQTYLRGLRSLSTSLRHRRRTFTELPRAAG